MDLHGLTSQADNHDVTASDSSITETLAFEYEFKDEKQAIKDYDKWQNHNNR